MNKLSSFFICFFIGVFLCSGCKSEQYKAFEAIKDSNDLSLLRDFSSKYNGDLEKKVSALYEVVFTNLLKDSTLYSAISKSSSILEKYNAEKDYVESLPEGIHIDEVKNNLLEHQPKAEALLEKIVDLQDIFKSYKFYQYSPSGEGFTFDFEIPDESGKGNVKVTADPITVKLYVDPWTYRYGIVNRHFVSSYYLSDDLKLHITVNESRTYGRHPEANQYSQEAVKELVEELKRQKPSPKPRTLLLTLDEGDGFPYLVGIDSNRKSCVLKASLR